jgi:hypothetical protein
MRVEEKEPTVIVSPLLSLIPNPKTSMELNDSIGPSVVLDTKLVLRAGGSLAVSFESLLAYVVSGFICVTLSVVTHTTSLGLSNILKSVKLVSSLLFTIKLCPLWTLLATGDVSPFGVPSDVGNRASRAENRFWIAAFWMLLEAFGSFSIQLLVLWM